MLILSLQTDGDQVAVTANGVHSHVFPPADLAFTPQQVEEFLCDPSPYGARLFAALFPEGFPARRMLDGLPLAPDPDGVLLLSVPAPAPGVPDLHSVPWEYLRDGRHFLATRYLLARAVDSPTPPAAASAPERLCFLFVPADPLLRPNGEPAPYALGVEEEWTEIRAILFFYLCPSVSICVPTRLLPARPLIPGGAGGPRWP